jgi:adenylate kinase family enzyme
MILLVGLPGSGKATVAKRRANLLLPAQNVQAVYQQPNAKPTEQRRGVNRSHWLQAASALLGTTTLRGNHRRQVGVDLESLVDAGNSH